MNNKNNLFELLEQLSTEELDRMLQNELQKEPVDGDAVRMILRVLRKQDEEQEAEIDAASQKAWEKYLRETKLQERKPVEKKNWMLRIAAAAAVLCLVLLVTPQDAEAESFIGMITRWTDSIFEFFDPKDTRRNPVEYEFKTDHPGLQQVYDTVVEMGVTDPVVPMWIPEGFELVKREVEKTDKKTSLIFGFKAENQDLVIQIDVYDSKVPRTYHKDEFYVETFEKRGNEHTFLRNNERWMSIWSIDNGECFLTTNCQEDIFHQIITSIYETEGE